MRRHNGLIRAERAATLLERRETEVVEALDFVAGGLHDGADGDVEVAEAVEEEQELEPAFAERADQRPRGAENVDRRLARHGALHLLDASVQVAAGQQD
eukprot:2123655-Rhodomonas_salina.1